jgi:probable rRNA maturation factor
MTRELVLRNRQQDCRIDGRQLRRIAKCLLTEVVSLNGFELGVHLVGPAEMTRLNGTFLHHAGSTDVITFDYGESVEAPVRASKGDGPCHESSRACLQGEIFICPHQAVVQARRFRTTWQAEIVRYLVHGVLHLLGYDDFRPRARRAMKGAEDRVVRALARRYALRSLAKASRRRPPARRAN